MSGRICVSCEAGATMQPFTDQTFTVAYRDRTRPVPHLAGWRCPACGEVEFDDPSARAYAEAGDGLVDAVREDQGALLRRVRRKLKLSQREAAALTGGGHNAFSRYERGKVEPMPAVVNLFRVLEKHPEVLRELQPENSGAPARQDRAGASSAGRAGAQRGQGSAHG